MKSIFGEELGDIMEILGLCILYPILDLVIFKRYHNIFYLVFDCICIGYAIILLGQEVLQKIKEKRRR